MKNTALRILYIAYYFPPLGGVASLRSVKMVKYLAAQGIHVSVVCLSPRGLNYPTDPSLLKDLPPSTRVYRFFCPDLSWFYKLLYGFKLGWLVNWLSRNLFIPDHYAIAHRLALAKLDSVIKREPEINLAVISSGPPSSLFLGLKLKARHGIDYICDFRDEWTNNPERLNINYPHLSQMRELIWEARVLTAAAGLSYLSGIMQDNFVSRYKFLESKPSRVVSNGFDEDDFAGVQPKNESSQKLRLLYTGSFYDRRQPDSLWQALEELFEEGKLSPQDITIKILGKNNQLFVLGTYYHKPAISSIVVFESFRAHGETISEILSTDALLLYIPSGLNTESVLTGKLFDYIRSYKPILSIVPPGGLAAEIVNTSGLGYVADYCDIEGIKAQIMKLYMVCKLGGQSDLQPNTDYISTFSRENQAAKLASLIRELAGQ